MVKGYKVFNPDWICIDKKYEVGKTYYEECAVLCESGMHFCKRLIDCFNYYSFNPKNKVVEVIAYGNVVGNGKKCCTDILEIVKEITWEEVLRLCNIGDYNTGKCNTGHYNAGSYNTGNCNNGNYNTGHGNTNDHNAGSYNIGYGNAGNFNNGDYNVEDCNTGDYNAGKCNVGLYNTGNYNIGYRNTGDFNNGNCNAGCFCTENQKIKLFNKLSNWDFYDWSHSEARDILLEMPVRKYTKWISTKDMSSVEKEENPSYKVTGGYLKICITNERAQKWWNNLAVKDKETVTALPNFDADIFEQCTGIKVDD